MNALLMALLVGAAPVKSGTASGHTTTPVPQGFAAKTSWHDGKKTRAIYESAVLVAEVTPTEDAKAALLKVDASAMISLHFPTVRIWRVSDANRVRQQLPALLPVYFDAATTAARQRVAIGGVNVFVKNTLTADQREVLRSELNATVTTSGMWTVPCEGVNAISLAATLGKRSDIELAVPNWWTPPNTR